MHLTAKLTIKRLAGLRNRDRQGFANTHFMARDLGDRYR